jgi:protein-S-isoprenylcysteine O-methyltransferase Ste14
MNTYIVRLFIFMLVSAGLVAVSWRSLKASRSHGFARFFAWEALAGLILLNAPFWFTNPFGPRQIIAWMLLFGAIPVALHGFWLLKQIGRPRQASLQPGGGATAAATSAANFAFENTTTLVTIGAYHYIRHPLYASLLILGAGAWLKDISTPATLLFGIAVGCLYMTARMEEDENEKRFGQNYTDYMRKTRMFIPYLF